MLLSAIGLVSKMKTVKFINEHAVFENIRVLLFIENHQH